MSITYLSKTIGNPVPCWKMYAVEVLKDDTFEVVSGFTDFALHPHEAVRMVANKIPEFGQFFWHLADNFNGERDFWVNVSPLEVQHDHPSIKLADGEKALLVSASLGSGEDKVYYYLYVQKATAQPYYQVHIGS
jgi:hypothetical protein